MQILFKTTDICLAAVLRINGYKLGHIELEGKRGLFFFADVKQNLIDHYNLDQVLVEPKELNHQIRKLTTSIKQMQE